jgi:hypothetical protein
MLVFSGWKMLGMRRAGGFCEKWVGWDKPQEEGNTRRYTALASGEDHPSLGERTLPVGYPAKHWLVMLMI